MPHLTAPVTTTPASSPSWASSIPWSSIITGAMGLLGGQQRNVASAKQASAQMQFQERMSSTSHQREVADLRAAGLNPILSATGGPGASTPPGAMAPMQDIITPAISSALAVKRLNQEIQNMRAQEKTEKARERLVRNQGRALGGPAGIGEILGEGIDWIKRSVTNKDYPAMLQRFIQEWGLGGGGSSARSKAQKHPDKPHRDKDGVMHFNIKPQYQGNYLKGKRK